MWRPQQLPPPPSPASPPPSTPAYSLSHPYAHNAADPALPSVVHGGGGQLRRMDSRTANALEADADFTLADFMHLAQGEGSGSEPSSRRNSGGAAALLFTGSAPSAAPQQPPVPLPFGESFLAAMGRPSPSTGAASAKTAPAWPPHQRSAEQEGRRLSGLAATAPPTPSVTPPAHHRNAMGPVANGSAALGRGSSGGGDGHLSLRQHMNVSYTAFKQRAPHPQQQEQQQQPLLSRALGQKDDRGGFHKMPHYFPNSNPIPTDSIHVQARNAASPPPLEVVEDFYRTCLHLERDVERDEQYVRTMGLVEEELRQLLAWSRAVCDEMTGQASGGAPPPDHNTRSSGGYGGGGHGSATGGRRMGTDLRTLGEVLKRLEVGERVLAPLEGTYLDLLKKYILNSPSPAGARLHLSDGHSQPAGGCPTVSQDDFESFAHAYVALVGLDAAECDEAIRRMLSSCVDPNQACERPLRSTLDSEGESGAPEHGRVDADLIDAILNTHPASATDARGSVAGNVNANERTDGVPAGAEGPLSEVYEMLMHLRSLHARQEAVRRRLLNELLFKNKNEGGDFSHGAAMAAATPSASPLPTAALAKEQRCVASGRASDVESFLLPPSPPPPAFSLEEDPILIVNIENDAAALARGDAVHCSPAFLAQLRQFESFQRKSYASPDAAGEGAGGGQPTDVFTVITTRARFACFHVVETLREVLRDLQTRVDKLLRQREDKLQALQVEMAALEVYDPNRHRVDEEKARLVGDMQVFLSWQTMMKKLAGRVVEPLRERVVSAILLAAMARKSLLDVLAQRIDDSHPQRPPALAGSARVTTSTCSAAETEAEDRFSHQDGDSPEADPQPPQPAAAASSSSTATAATASAPAMPRASAAFLSMLEDIASEQARLLHQQAGRAAPGTGEDGEDGEEGGGGAGPLSTAASSPSAAAVAASACSVSGLTATRKRGRAEDAPRDVLPSGGFEGADGHAQREAGEGEPRAEMDPFLEMDVSTATPSRRSSTDADAADGKDKAEEERQTATEATGAEALWVPPMRSLVAAHAGVNDEESVSETDENGRLRREGRRAQRRRARRRAYGLRSFFFGGDVSEGRRIALGGAHDGDSDADSTARAREKEEEEEAWAGAPDEASSGGGFWKGVNAFVKAVVERATRFSDSSTDEDGEEDVANVGDEGPSKRRRM